MGEDGMTFQLPDGSRCAMLRDAGNHRPGKCGPEPIAVGNQARRWLAVARGRRWDAGRHNLGWFGGRFASIGVVFWRGGVTQIFNVLTARDRF